MTEFVWVTQGKQQHQAILLVKGEFYSRIKWPGDGKKEDVPNTSIELCTKAKRPTRNLKSDDPFHPEKEEESLLCNLVGSASGRPADDASSSSFSTTDDDEGNSSDDGLTLTNLVTSQRLQKKSRRKIAVKKKKSAPVPPQAAIDNDSPKATTSDENMANETDTGNDSDDQPLSSFPEVNKRISDASSDTACPQPRKRLKSTALKTSSQGPEPQPQEQSRRQQMQRSQLAQLFQSEKRSDPIPTMRDSGTVETLAPAGKETLATVPTSAPIEETIEQPPKAIIADTSNQNPTQYTGKSSAYLQNLAEICYSIVSDRRWQGLFRWEHEDDLRAVEALQRMYIPLSKPVVDVKCGCLLCKDEVTQEHRREEEVPAFTASSESSVDESVTDELTDESLYLYSRMFYRKGPWYRFDNIYHTLLAQPRNGGKNALAAESVLDHHLEVSLPLLFQRISKLENMGLIRGFASEHECGSVCDTGSLFRAEELVKVNSRLGGKQGNKSARKGSIPSFVERVSTQRTLFSDQCVQLIRQVKSVILENFACDLVSRCCESAENITARTPLNKSLVDRATKHLSELQRKYEGFPLFFRLNEGPVYTLRRVVRLYLCANSGPGEMRGTETNGWQSVSDTAHTYKRGELSPPCAGLWHKIRYPGLDFRFGLQSFCFMNSYKTIPIEAVNANVAQSNEDKIFASYHEFRKWETCAELRSNVDYLISCADRSKRNSKASAGGLEDAVDVLDVLTGEGRGVLINILTWDLAEQHFSGELAKTLCRSVSQDIRSIPEGMHDSSRLLCAIAILSAHVLHEAIRHEEKHPHCTLRTSPWLRHLSWRSCLAGIIWDVVPILEQARLYQLAARANYLLFVGNLLPGAPSDSEFISAVLRPSQPKPLAQLLLSRRTRTKVFDRLLIDTKHLHTKRSRAIDMKGDQRQDASSSKKDGIERKRQLQESFHREMGVFCVVHCRLGAESASLGFSSLRGISQRLKAPLTSILENSHILEAAVLGLRTQNAADNTASTKMNPICEWRPTIDDSVANSLTENTGNRGTRTSFIGHEDDVNELVQSRSLNVEEYAKELYKSGRLPISDKGVGGWEGWPDDEGRVVRALFRIICGAPLFGTDFGCCQMVNDPMQARIFLTPYQQAPADLHVSYQKIGYKRNSTQSITTESSTCKGFYQRRYKTIFSLCEKLKSLNDQEISDVVFDSIAARLHYMHQANRKDPVVERDVAQLRTLSAVAAGYGGAQLAAAFTTLLFDYRTYSGGLPDVQLFRAVQRDQENNEVKLVDLAWIGESFSPQRKAMAHLQQAQALLFDDNDEYLGCSKDSSGRWRKPITTKSTKETTVPSPEQLPERLQLVQNGAKVWIECMSVEVKSHNDVLSSRQVDWLNILDQNGYSARVCKFRSNNQAKKPKKSPVDT